MPHPPSPPSLLQTVDHSSNKTWFVFTCDGPWWDGFSADRQRWHICLIALDPSCSLLLDWVETGKLETSSVLSGKERNFKYAKATALSIKWKSLSARLRVIN